MASKRHNPENLVMLILATGCPLVDELFDVTHELQYFR